MRTPFRPGSTTALAMLLGLCTGHAVAQLDDGQGQCPGIDCTSGVSVGPFTPPAGWTLTPDRRPAIVIPLRNGGNNPLKLHPSWYDNDDVVPTPPPTDMNADGVPDVFEWLLDRLDEAYDLGYRRIIMRLPAGNPTQTWASSQWWTLVDWKRTGFETYVAAWLDAKDLAGDPVTLGVFAGYKINDPCDLDMFGSSPPDPTDADDMCVVYQNIQPWIDVGITEYWFDYSSGYWEDMSTLQHSSNYTGVIRFGGEAVPHDGSDCTGQHVPLPAAVAASPFAAAFRYVVGRFGDAPMVDPATTDLAVMFSGHEIGCGQRRLYEMWQAEDLFRLVDAGWVAWTDGRIGVRSYWQVYDFSEAPPSADPRPPETYTFDYSFDYAVEAVYRAYDFGQLTAVVDFNSDGLIEANGLDTDDLDEFTVAWTKNYNKPGGYRDGDVNGDGFVDMVDFQFFADAEEAWRLNNGQLIGVDLGPAWWHP